MTQKDSRPTVLVTAASGNQGKLLVPKLAAAGYKVRAVRATANKEEELRRLGAQEVLVADLSDADVYARALEGVDAVYHIGPGAHPREREMGLALVQAAQQTGVRHVVFSSVLHPIIDILQHRMKRDIEERLVETGLNYTVLKPANFMMAPFHITPAVKSGVYPVVWSLERDLPVSLVDLGDLTDVALKVIREGAVHYRASYDLCAVDKPNAKDIATILTRVIGRPVTAVQATPEDYLRILFGTDDPGDVFRHEIAILRSIADWYSKYEFVGNSNVLTWLLGRPPTTFEEFARAACAEAH